MTIPATGGEFLPTTADPGDRRHRPERDQTDESLRVERRSVDESAEHWAAIDETANAIVSRARARADAVLAAARARTDRQSATSAATGIIERQRALEDRAIRTERPQVRITRLARGLPVGGDIEYADEITLSSALTNRKEL